MINRIETKHLFLREITIENAKDYLDNVTTKAQNIKEAENEIIYLNNLCKENNEIIWGVFEKNNGILIGKIGVVLSRVDANDALIWFNISQKSNKKFNIMYECIDNFLIKLEEYNFKNIIRISNVKWQEEINILKELGFSVAPLPEVHPITKIEFKNYKDFDNLVFLSYSN